MLALTALLFSAATAQKVVVGTNKNFDSIIADNTHVLAEFYAPWCGHCKKLAPEYDAAAKKLKDEDVVLMKVDATEEEELGKRFEVRGYPTLKWFKNGKVKDYDGGRSADTIVSWVMKKVGPVLTEIADAAALEKFKSKGDVVVVGQFAAGSDDLAAFKAVAESMDAPFGYTTDAGVASGITVFKTFDKGSALFSGDIAKDLETFVNGESVPVVMTWADNQEMMGKLQVPLVFSGHDGKDEEGATAALKVTAEKNKGKYLFYTVDTEKKENSRLLEFFGLEAGEVVVFDQNNRKKFKTADVAKLGELLADIESGTAQPIYKSEKPPADNSAPVTVIVGTEFDKIVKDTTKDVLVEFYAPWCGHCKQLAPKWDKLGKKFEDDANVVIAKMDATANEIPEPEVKGFPTIYFFPAAESDGVVYQGGRDVDDFVDFIKENRKSSPAKAGHDEL